MGKTMPLSLLNIGNELEFVEGADWGCGMQCFFGGVRIFGHNRYDLVRVDGDVANRWDVLFVVAGLQSVGWCEFGTCMCT